MDSTRAALENALVATPHDYTLHCAYADYLHEHNDPRGEYILIQLALEDRNQPVERLREMEQRAFQIREKHQAKWLGPLAPYVLIDRRGRSVAEPGEPAVQITWKRGWVDMLNCSHLYPSLQGAIATSPATRLLGGLEILLDEMADAENQNRASLNRIRESGRLQNIRNFQIRCPHTPLPLRRLNLEEAFRAMPHVEEFYLHVPHLSVERVFSNSYPKLRSLSIATYSQRMPIALLGRNAGIPDLSYLRLEWHRDFDRPLQPFTASEISDFFRSPYLTKMKELIFRLPGFGDDGVRELIDSGFINRLERLNLRGCVITDTGAQLLAACRHVRNLQTLHLGNNLLSPIGIEALAEVGFEVGEQLFGGILLPDDEGDIPF